MAKVDVSKLSKEFIENWEAWVEGNYKGFCPHGEKAPHPVTGWCDDNSSICEKVFSGIGDSCPCVALGTAEVVKQAKRFINQWKSQHPAR